MSRKGCKKKGYSMKPSKTAFGNLIRSRRVELNLSQVQVAQKIGVAHKTISKWEIRSFPEDSSLPSIRKLAGVLNLDECSLVTLIEEFKRQPLYGLGKFLFKRRLELGFSLTDLAAKSKLSRESLQAIEKSSSRLSILHTEQLAEALACTPDELRAHFAEFNHYPTKSEEKPLGTFLRTRRKVLGYSRHTLAKKIGVEEKSLANFERMCAGYVLEDYGTLLEKISSELGISPSDLAKFKRKRRVKHVRDSQTTFGKFFMAHRLALELTRAELSRKTGITAYRLKVLEYGLDAMPTTDELQKLSAVIGEIPPEVIPH